MKEKTKKNFNIGQIIFIVLLMTICFIGGYMLGTNFESSKENKETNITDTDKEISDGEKYQSIINEYSKAINDKETAKDYDSDNISKKYPNVNANMIADYFKNLNDPDTKNMTLNYTFYDINKDKKNELIVATNNSNIIQIYTYNNDKISGLFDVNGANASLGYRENVQIYDNGILLSSGSNGYNNHDLDFYKIDDNGINSKKIKSYTIITNEKNTTITDNNTNTETKYTNTDEIINSIVGNAKKVDLNNLEWKEIK